MERLIEIINSWDPIGLFPMAPKDEYFDEVSGIYEYLRNHENVKAEDLAKAINIIFKNAFGENIYIDNIDECKKIAKKILNFREI